MTIECPLVYRVEKDNVFFTEETIPWKFGNSYPVQAEVLISDSSEELVDRFGTKLTSNENTI
jgi:hypothetical protein